MTTKAQNHNKLVVTTLLVATFLVLSVFLSHSFAQNTISSQSLEISPPSQEITVDPGQAIPVKAKVRNTSSQEITIKVGIQDFTAQGDEGQVALIDNSPYSLVSWAKLDNDNFSLKPGETKEVTANINVPKDAAGGRYGSFVFSVEGGKAAPGTASVAQEIASLFLVKVNGPVTENLSIEQFKAPKFSEFGPIGFELKFKNLGNVHVKPFGLINITDVFGRVVKDVVVPGQFNIFPGASRIIMARLDNKWLFGPYKAQALINYGSKNQAITAQTTFFVFPVRLVAAFLLIIIVLFYSRKRIFKAFKALAGK